jgi:serine/threonine protein phosphatase PrpC
MDPNEDVVGAFSGPGGTLVALADGHNGRDSAAIVIAYVAEHLGKEPGPRSLRGTVTNVIYAAGEAIQREASWKNARAPESRTTFAAAAAHGRDLAFATMGDSALFVCGHGGSRRLDDPKHHFVGYPMTKDEIRERLITGEETLGDGEWVVLVTDGFTDFPPGAVPRLGGQIDSQRSAEAAVRSLIEAAFEGGAGDNVAAAVISPWDAAIDPLILRGALPSIEACFRDRFRHWGITLPAADVAERRPGHIFRAGWHIGYVWGDDENGIYLEYLSQHRMTSDSRRRIYESGHVEQIELPSTLVPYPDDPAERARINQESAREHREANTELRDLGLLPPAGTNQPAIEINEYLRSREPEDGAG